MLIFGSRGNVLDLGEVQTHHCPVCERERPFHIVLQYRYWHLWFLFALVTKKVYSMSCNICGRGTQLKPAEAEQFIGKSPIPFMHRWGLALLVGVVAVFVLLAQIGVI